MFKGVVIMEKAYKCWKSAEISDDSEQKFLRIDNLHKKNLFKLKLMPVFEPDIASVQKI